jgi:hypothetical protein
MECLVSTPMVQASVQAARCLSVILVRGTVHPTQTQCTSSVRVCLEQQDWIHRTGHPVQIAGGRLTASVGVSLGQVAKDGGDWRAVSSKSALLLSSGCFRESHTSALGRTAGLNPSHSSPRTILNRGRR